MSSDTISQDLSTSHQEAEPTGAATSEEQVLVEDELLVEEVSIDGMCGVY